MAAKSVIPDNVESLVTKAFVLEALTDKPGCTTRYEDLPGKPLQDFIIAGINSGRAFQDFANALRDDPNTPVFSFNLAALKASNLHKSTKFLNFGLLEIMFPVVAARLTTADPKTVIEQVIKLVKRSTNDDVKHIMATRQLAWSTSQTQHKIDFDLKKYQALPTVWDFYMAVNKDYGPSNSHYEWTEQYKRGLPILQAFFNTYTESGEVLKTTTEVFTTQRAENPQIAVGILADMCASAIFLWLSFNTKPV